MGKSTISMAMFLVYQRVLKFVDVYLGHHLVHHLRMFGKQCQKYPEEFDDLTDDWNAPFLGCWVLHLLWMNMNERDVFHISEWKFVVGICWDGCLWCCWSFWSRFVLLVFLDLSRDSIVLPGIFFTVYSSGSTARAVFPASMNACKHKRM